MAKTLSSLGIASWRLPRRAERSDEARWNLSELIGRLTELGSPGSGATLTPAFRLVWDAQVRGEPVAWIMAGETTFFPPDAEEGGIDLAALVVVRVAEAAAIGRAADPLLRSGAFGLVVLDLGAHAVLPLPLQARLLGLAQKHETALLCLTEKSSEAPSLGSLVSLRAEVRMQPAPPPLVVFSNAVSEDEGTLLCHLQVLKDKQRPPGWTHQEICRAPAGLR